ncbi:MAG: hypothetical protein EHM28_02695, partial [Spirochaetaceae bacterium]
MRQSLKIAFTLLISLVVSGVFTVLAFSNLFSAIETSVYLPNLKNRAVAGTEKTASRMITYHDLTVSRYREITASGFMWRAYLANQSQEDIALRANAMASLMQGNSRIMAVRLVDLTGRRINYSTVDGDIEPGSDVYRITYSNLDRVEPEASVDRFVLAEKEDYRIVWDDTKQRIIYVMPVVDPDKTRRGVALFYVQARDLESYLSADTGVAFRDLYVAGNAGALCDVSGIVAGLDETDISVFTSAVKGAFESSSSEIRTEAFRVGDAGQKLYLFFKNTGVGGVVGILFGSSNFEMGLADKIIILLIFYSLVFLVILLVLNIKQEPMVVVAGRMKKFQNDFVAEFVD